MSPHVEPYDSGSEISESRSETPPALTNGNGVNGHNARESRHRERSSYVLPSEPDSEFDLVCVGFGPASLAVAVALHDALAAGRRLNTTAPTPKVLFLEKQSRFAWHAGMLLPGAKMQISFVKDLATLRDPRSEFTFLNYLHRQGRLVDFTNLSTFLPARLEYEDYMRWCSSFFDDVVSYGHRVVNVSPEKSASGTEGVQTFSIRSEDIDSGKQQTFRARNVLIAAGGQPSLPRNFPLKHPRVIHSSQYANTVPRILTKSTAPYRVAVVGAGQSAAEIFNNVQTLYPNSQTYLVMRPEFLRPSDDSPFVNQVFNPEYIDELYPKPARYRSNLLAEARSTNYGVVRLELIEQLFESMYDQRRELGPDESKWTHRILGGRQIVSLQGSDDGPLELRVRKIDTSCANGSTKEEDDLCLKVDLVIAATGYQRAAHVEMLRDTWDMLPTTVPTDDRRAATTGLKAGVTGWDVQTEKGERKLAVGRDYQVQYAPGTVADKTGVWLQGCCEGTHGLSDTLLSVLATRSGDIVDSIFGKEDRK